MINIIQTSLVILVSVLVVFVQVGNRQAETVIVNQLNEIIKRLARLERA